MSSLHHTIAKSRWGSVLTGEQQRRVEADTVVRAIPKGAYACRRGDPASYWIGVIDGLVKISSVSSVGKVMTFSGVHAGGWFGEGSLLKDEPMRYDAVALRDSQIAYLSRATFLWLLDNNPQFSRFLLVHLNERLGQAMRIIESGRLLGPNGRLAQCLASLFSPTLYPGVEPMLKLSQEEIGHLVGLSRQSVNAGLKTLESAGLLRVEYAGVVIQDVTGLREFEG